MRNRLTGAFIATVLGCAVTLPLAAQQRGRQGGPSTPAPSTGRSGQGGAAARGRGATPAARLDRIAGHPNLNGIWQATNTANWNLEGHSASATPFWQLGAMFA